MDRYLNIQEVSEYLGLSRMTVYNMVKNGELPQGYKFRGARRWNFEELKDFLKGAKNAG